MTNDNDRDRRLASRFENPDENGTTDEADPNDEGDENDANSVNDANDDDDTDAPTVRDTRGRTFHVGDDVLSRVDRLHKELDLDYEDQFGEDLPKNRVYYTALLEVAVDNPDQVADALGLKDDSDEE